MLTRPLGRQVQNRHKQRSLILSFSSTSSLISRNPSLSMRGVTLLAALAATFALAAPTFDHSNDALIGRGLKAAHKGAVATEVISHPLAAVTDLLNDA